MSLSWVQHTPLRRQIVIEMELLNVEPLRIGASKELHDIVDLPILKMRTPEGIEVPVIPGSSLKGVMRTVAEGLWSEVIGRYVHEDNNKGFPACPVTNELDALKKDLRKGRISPEEAAMRTVSLLCPVCLTFGAPSYMSKTLIYDFFSKGCTTNMVTQAMIHRKKGTAENPRKVEYVEPGCSFKGKIILNNSPNWMVSLVLSTLYFIDQGFVKLGGHKSRGFGRVEIRDLDVKVVKDLDGSNGQVLKPWDEVDEELEVSKLYNLEYALEKWKSMAQRLKDERYND